MYHGLLILYVLYNVKDTDERKLEHQPLITDFPTFYLVLYFVSTSSNFNFDNVVNLLLQDTVLPIVSKETRQIRHKSL
jgi:hypothetical protein